MGLKQGLDRAGSAPRGGRGAVALYTLTGAGLAQ